MSIRSSIVSLFGDRNPKPHFRFHPRCYDDGTLRESSERCVVCGKTDRWMYEDSCYSEVEDSPVCAPCIAGDRLRAHFGKHFSFHDVQFSAEPGRYEKEVMQLTPGFATVNPFTWPVRNGVPMAYLGRGEEAQFWENPQCRNAMLDFWHDQQDEELDGPTPHIMVFQSLDGSAYGFDIDWC